MSKRGALYRPRGVRVSWLAILRCWVFGHDGHRIRGTFYLKCDRCEAFGRIGR